MIYIVFALKLVLKCTSETFPVPIMKIQIFFEGIFCDVFLEVAPSYCCLLNCFFLNSEGSKE